MARLIYANVHADGHRANSIFAESDAVHRHNPTYTPRLLREKFLERGIELNTPDVNGERPVAFDLHVEGRPLGPDLRPRYLIALENPNINPLNSDRIYCGQFDLAFSWDARLHDLANVVPILIPHPLLWEPFPGPEQRPVFSCLINANKGFKRPLPEDLYQERLAVIRWYEKNAPSRFALYGMGWHKLPPEFTPTRRLLRGIAQLKAQALGQPAFPSYRGELTDKASALKASRFSYCYENSRDLANYVTEKIFDSLVNGCVPIYWGADNVQDLIPETSYIDRRQFRDTGEVHHVIEQISDGRYREYQQDILGFLSGARARRFSADHIMNTVVERICRHLGTLPDQPAMISNP